MHEDYEVCPPTPGSAKEKISWGLFSTKLGSASAGSFFRFRRGERKDFGREEV